MTTAARTVDPTRVAGVSRWFSANPDKAWAEKLYLLFIPVFFAYNALIQNMGWLDAGDFWHVVQNLGMWAPYCVVLPWLLRRGQPIPLYRQWWFKFQVYMAVIVFFMTYFHTEYFFDVLGMRYRFDRVSLYFDSALLGPDQSTALSQWKRVPVGMYLNTMAFFSVYHCASVVVIRRLSGFASDLGPASRRLAFVATVTATAVFFAWAETFFYITGPASTNVWYLDKATMLALGSWFYALYFIVTFPSIYRLDERTDQPAWSLGRIAIEASAASMIVLLLCDLWVLALGADFMGV